MKCLEIEKISKVVDRNIIYNENGYVIIKLYPHQLCLACGWDKPEYDNYFLKHCAGTLIGIEKQCFEKLYYGIQQVLAEMEALSLKVNKNGKPLLSPSSCKITTELWNPISFSNKNSTKISQIDRLKKLKEQQEAPTDSPVVIE